MGQQQVLLLALLFCILGIVFSVHLINAEGESVQTNRDALIDDLYKIAARAQQYYHRSFEEEGGDNSFRGLTRGIRGIESLKAAASTAHGEYFVVEPGNARTVQLLGVGIERGLNSGLPVRVLMTVWSDSTSVSILN